MYFIIHVTIPGIKFTDRCFAPLERCEPHGPVRKGSVAGDIPSGWAVYVFRWNKWIYRVLAPSTEALCCAVSNFRAPIVRGSVLSEPMRCSAGRLHVVAQNSAEVRISVFTLSFRRYFNFFVYSYALLCDLST